MIDPQELKFHCVCKRLMIRAYEIRSGLSLTSHNLLKVNFESGTLRRSLWQFPRALFCLEGLVRIKAPEVLQEKILISVSLHKAKAENQGKRSSWEAILPTAQKTAVSAKNPQFSENEYGWNFWKASWQTCDGRTEFTNAFVLIQSLGTN